MSLADRINQCSEKFTPAEHRIAQILFSTNLLAGLETIAKLGEKARVSGPTVLRFASKLGFEGYPELQDYLRADIENRLASPLDLYKRQQPESAPQGLAKSAAHIFSESIERTLSRIDLATLDRVATLLANGSRPVHFVGGRFTQHLAEILWGHVHQLRPNAHVLRSGVVAPRDLLVDIGRRDILVVFDVRRYQPDVIRLAELTKARRATIVLITDPLLSPISRVANHILTCDLDAPSPYDSLVPCMAVLELIVAAMIRKSKDAGRERILAIEELRQLNDDH